MSQKLWLLEGSPSSRVPVTVITPHLCHLRAGVVVATMVIAGHYCWSLGASLLLDCFFNLAHPSRRSPCIKVSSLESSKGIMLPDSTGAFATDSSVTGLVTKRKVAADMGTWWVSVSSEAGLLLMVRSCVLPLEANAQNANNRGHSVSMKKWG